MFGILGLPGLAIAVLVARTVREPAAMQAAPGSVDVAPYAATSTESVFSHRNVPLAMIAELCATSSIFVLAALVPSYIPKYLKLDDQTAGLVASAIGFDGFVGKWGLPAASDLLGRRTMVFCGFAASVVFLFLFIHLDGRGGAPLLFATLFVTAVFAFGLLSPDRGPNRLGGRLVRTDRHRNRPGRGQRRNLRGRRGAHPRRVHRAALWLGQGAVARAIRPLDRGGG